MGGMYQNEIIEQSALIEALKRLPDPREGWNVYRLRVEHPRPPILLGSDDILKPLPVFEVIARRVEFRSRGGRSIYRWKVSVEFLVDQSK